MFFIRRVFAHTHTHLSIYLSLFNVFYSCDVTTLFRLTKILSFLFLCAVSDGSISQCCQTRDCGQRVFTQCVVFFLNQKKKTIFIRKTPRVCRVRREATRRSYIWTSRYHDDVNYLAIRRLSLSSSKSIYYSST